MSARPASRREPTPTQARVPRLVRAMMRRHRRRGGAITAAATLFITGCGALTMLPTTTEAATASEGAQVLAGGPRVSVAPDDITRHMILADDAEALAQVRAVLDLAGRTPEQVWDTALHGVSVDISASTAATVAAIDGVQMIGAPQPIAPAASQEDPPWGLDRLDQAELPLDARYTYDSDGTGVIVYVIDSGLRADHDDVTGKVPYGAYYDYAAGRLVGPTDSGWADCTGHGTHVASIAAGVTSGVAKGATIVPIKVLGSATNPCDAGGESDAVVAAIDWILDTHPTNTPGVAIMSFGVVPLPGDTDGIDPILDAAVAALVEGGIATAVAAGNIDATSPVTDACLLSPARVSAVITVGASDANDRVPEFSAGGDCVDIIAPGVSIRAAGIGGRTDRTAVRTGTSMAAPHVAGIAARILSDTPQLTPQQVTDTITAAGLAGVLDRDADQPDLLAHIDADAVAVMVTVDGYGTVDGLGAASCTTMCTTLVAVGTEVTVTASTNEWSTFAGWTGACADSTSASCTFVVDAALDVGAIFTADDLVPVTPTRIADTRSGLGGVPAAPVGRADGTGEALRVTVTGRGGVPSSAVAAVAVNLTATGTIGTGFVTAYPCDAVTVPNVSQLNFTTGRTVANSAILQVDDNGRICLYVFGSAHLIVDVSGWMPDGGGYRPVTPQRIVDTRGSIGAIGTTTSIGTTVMIDPVGAGLPTTGVGTVAINVTAVDAVPPPEGGYASAYPCTTADAPPPNVSTLNFTSTMTVPNSALVPTGYANICVFVYGQADVLIDVVGWFTAEGDLKTSTPRRVVDTRGGVGAPPAPVGTSDGTAPALMIDLAAVAGLPADAAVAVVNVTAANTTTAAVGGYVSLYPCATAAATPPNVSTLNFATGDIVANGALVRLDSGRMCVYSYGTTDVIIDLAGWFAS